jgi:hypothetical protein
MPSLRFLGRVGALLAFALQGAVSAATLIDLKKSAVFDGIDPKEAAEFWNRWHLLTVRYRNDAGEQRFIYANDVAWKAVRSGALTFPNGSMLGKIAFFTRDDPSFPVSVEPSTVSRIQLMKKDSKAYPDTGGWGYAIYPGESDPASAGKSGATRDIQELGGPPAGPGSERAIVTACFGCHVAVASRDYVFSRPALFRESQARLLPAPDGFDTRFHQAKFDELTSLGKKAIRWAAGTPAPLVEVASMHVFSGTLHEALAPLARYAARDGVPYLLVDELTQQYLVAAPQGAASGCKNPVRVAIRNLALNPTFLAAHPEVHDGVVYELGQVCSGVNTWTPVEGTPD